MSNPQHFVLFRGLIFVPCKQELDHVVEELEKIAVVNLAKGRAIISLIGNVQHSSLILERVRSHLLDGSSHRVTNISKYIFFKLLTGVSCSLDQRHQCPDDITRSIQGKHFPYSK